MWPRVELKERCSGEGGKCCCSCMRRSAGKSGAGLRLLLACSGLHPLVARAVTSSTTFAVAAPFSLLRRMRGVLKCIYMCMRLPA